MYEKREHDKISYKELNGTERSNLSDKELLERCSLTWLDELSENLYAEIENMEKKH